MAGYIERAIRGRAARQGQNIRHGHGGIDGIQSWRPYSPEHVDPAQDQDVDGRIAEQRLIGGDDGALRRVGGDLADIERADLGQQHSSVLVHVEIAAEIRLAPNLQANLVTRTKGIGPRTRRSRAGTEGLRLTWIPGARGAQQSNGGHASAPSQGRGRARW